MLWLVVLRASGGAGPAEDYELKVKAVCLFKFAKFVQWPPQAFTNASAPLVIGVVGDDPFRSLLDAAVSGETAAGRPFAVRRFAAGEDCHAAHLLFVSTSEGDRLPALLANLGTNAVLTVSDLDRFTEAGGMIQFLPTKVTVRFKINQAATARSGLKVSAQLMQLSQSAKTD
jgi:hypothetical protein